MHDHGMINRVCNSGNKRKYVYCVCPLGTVHGFVLVTKVNAEEKVVRII